MRIGIDVTPLLLSPRRGVATAVRALVTGLEEVRGDADIVYFAPFLGDGVDRLGESEASMGATSGLPDDLASGAPGRLSSSLFVPRPWSGMAWRRRAPGLARRRGIDVWYSPWSAFPDVSCSLVVTVHELPFVRLGAVEGRLRDRRHRRWLARDVARADRMVVPSEATRDDVLALHKEAAPRLRVVPHGFVVADGRVPATAPPRGTYALVVGGRSRRKGMDVWLDARRRLGDEPRWVLVGHPPRRVARSLRDDSRVRVVSEATEPERGGWVRGASLLVYPSLSEGFGFPPLEAMAAGVPVVATTAGSIPEVCGDAALLVPPRDSVALADAIRRVLDDADLRARLVLAGRERARAFPPAAAARRLLAVLEEAAAEGPR